MYKLLKGKGIARGLPMTKTWYNVLFAGLLEGIVETRVNDHKMLVDLSDFLGRSVFMYEVYEVGTTMVFKDILKPGMRVVDVGANIGYFTLLSAIRVGPAGKVYAFEAEPTNCQILRENIRRNHFTNTVVVQSAVSDKVGRTTLFLRKNSRSHHTLIAKGGENGIAVKSTTLDEYFKEGPKQIDLAKIDVEGAELAVLSGMQSAIKSNPHIKIITEFSPPLLMKAGVAPKHFLEYVNRLKFSVAIINEHPPYIEKLHFKQLLEIATEREYINLFLSN